MTTTPTFDAIHTLIQRRNALIEDRGRVRVILRGALDNGARQAREIEFWHIVGQIDGIKQALTLLQDAGEHVASAEWLVIEEAAKRRSAA